MMIYQKYLARNIAGPFLYSILILTSIAWLSQVLRLAYLFEQQIFFAEFLFLTTLMIPSLIHGVLPFAMLYGALYAYNNLRSNKELIVLESAGVNKSQLIQPLIYLGLVTSLVAIINSSLIMPLSYNTMKEMLYKYRSNFASSALQEGVFSPISRNVVVYLNKKVNSKKLEGIIVFDYRHSGPPAILFAEEGNIQDVVGTLSLNLSSGSRHSFSKNGAFEMMNFERFNVNLLQEKAGIRSAEEKDSLEQYIWDLLYPKNVARAKGVRFVSEGHGRITWSLMSLILPLCAASFFVTSEFNRNYSLKNLITSFGFAFVFVMIHFFSMSAAANAISCNYLLYMNLLAGLGCSSYILRYRD